MSSTSNRRGPASAPAIRAASSAQPADGTPQASASAASTVASSVDAASSTKHTSTEPFAA
ncbi:hypothetical protein [Burkholderia oklahomensis]|uniref:hypothetical protein n=1 Tax=Burkholderia oklahomensis TaxID=342113 RepID=UPI001E3184D9|nr:hypothetical protein [Burkholderia oklahomensis]